MIIAALLLATTTSSIDYRFDQVKRKVGLNGVQVSAGGRAHSGDKVETGWFSYALIASDHYRAKFEIFSSTNVQLAGGAPGVILTLERGKLHAMFDKITGSEPRVVETPGALLAVRGTQYEVQVGDDGRTNLKVFEGTVEVRSHLRPQEPVLVHAGEMTNFGRQEPPTVRPMPQGDRDRDRGADGVRQRGGHPEGGMHGGTPPPTKPESKPPQGEHH